MAAIKQLTVSRVVLRRKNANMSLEMAMKVRKLSA
jgi:hypothetical protein